MTKSKSTKHALLCSVLATVLCAAMLVGTTFAWFTDSVTSGRNRIAAGNLDVELYHGDALDETVNGATDLFTNADGSAILWEPGAIAYENFKVANEGSLALKYQLAMNIVDYNTVEGKSLADVLKVAVLEGETFTGDRTAAQALTFDSTLSDFVKEGNLAAEAEDTYAVVIYWEPGANDNDYNLNNGKTSSDGEPLYIDLGITLTATQDTVESDSFDNQYDAGALYPIVYASTAEELADAVENAAPGDTVVLQEDVQITTPIKVTQAMTIDLGTHTITSSRTPIELRADGATIKATTGGIKMTGNNRCFYISSGDDPIPINVTIDGGVYESEGSYLLETWEDTPATINIKNITYSGDRGISCSSHDAVINVIDSTISTTGYSAFYIGASTVCNLERVTMIADGLNGIFVNTTMQDEGEPFSAVYIKSGFYSGETRWLLNANEGCTISVTGGTFSENPEEYVAAGYTVEENSNGTFTVVPLP